MRHFDEDTVRAAAAANGFDARTTEKVLVLLALLAEFERHRELDGRLALKGGMALNAFHLPLPRLSVDVDLDYLGETADLDTRKQVSSGIHRACRAVGLNAQAPKEAAALTSWRPEYVSVVTGRRDRVKIDLGWTNRAPLWPTVLAESHALTHAPGTRAHLRAIEEIVAGKICALLERDEVRDPYDAGNILGLELCDERLRVAVTVAIAARRHDIVMEPDRLSPITLSDIDAGLRPVLRATDAPSESLLRELVVSRARLLQHVFPLREPHRTFLDLVNTQGIIDPTLLTEDRDLQRRIAEYPHLHWKVQHVRDHRGLDGRAGS